MNENGRTKKMKKSVLITSILIAITNIALCQPIVYESRFQEKTITKNWNDAELNHFDSPVRLVMDFDSSKLTISNGHENTYYLTKRINVSESFDEEDGFKSNNYTYEAFDKDTIPGLIMIQMPQKATDLILGKYEIRIVIVNEEIWYGYYCSEVVDQ